MNQNFHCNVSNALAEPQEDTEMLSSDIRAYAGHEGDTKPMRNFHCGNGVG